MRCLPRSSPERRWAEESSAERRGVEARPLQPADSGDAQLGDELGIFGEAFVGAAPAVVAATVTPAVVAVEHFKLAAASFVDPEEVAFDSPCLVALAA